MIEAKLFDVCGWPVEVIAKHEQTQPTSTEPGTAQFEILGTVFLENPTTVEELNEVILALDSGPEYDRIREEFLTNPLL